MFSLIQRSGIGVIIGLVLACQTASPSSAQGQPVSCGERDSMLEQLRGTYEEKQVAAGVTADGRLLEVFAGASGSWTVLITYPNGPTCIATAGDGWRQVKPGLDGPLV